MIDSRHIVKIMNVKKNIYEMYGQENDSWQKQIWSNSCKAVVRGVLFHELRLQEINKLNLENLST